jgi:hypothetical protein
MNGGNTWYEGGGHMKCINAVVLLLLCMALVVGLVSLGVAGEQRQTPVKEYEGQVKSIRIDKCGLQPGTCEGSIVLAQRRGGDVALVIKPGTWIQRGDNLVLIDELAVGNYLKAQAAQLPGSKDELAITLKETARE